MSNCLRVKLTNLYLKPFSFDNSGATSGPAVIIQAHDAAPSTDTIHLKYTNGDDTGSFLSSGTNGDGATAEASYDMTFHQPVEWGRSMKPDTTYERPATVHPDNPGYANAGGAISCTWNEPSFLWVATADILGDGANAPWEDLLGKAKGSSWVGVLCAVIGSIVTINTPQPEHGIAVFDSVWNAPDSTFSVPRSPSYPTPQDEANAKALYQMQPHRKIGYTRTDWIGDCYDIHGYSGQIYNTTSVKNGGGHWWGQFVYIGPNMPAH